MANDPQNQKRSNKASQYAKFSGVAFQMIAVIVLGSYGGMKLDEHYPNKYNLWTVFGSILSVFVATYLAVKQVLDISKKNDE